MPRVGFGTLRRSVFIPILGYHWISRHPKMGVLKIIFFVVIAKLTYQHNSVVHAPVPGTHLHGVQRLLDKVKSYIIQLYLRLVQETQKVMICTLNTIRVLVGHCLDAALMPVHLGCKTCVRHDNLRQEQMWWDSLQHPLDFRDDYMVFLHHPDPQQQSDSGVLPLSLCVIMQNSKSASIMRQTKNEHHGITAIQCLLYSPTRFFLKPVLYHSCDKIQEFSKTWLQAKFRLILWLIFNFMVFTQFNIGKSSTCSPPSFVGGRDFTCPS